MSSQLRLSLYGALATTATSLSLMSVFSTDAWVLPVFAAIILVTGTCALIRMSPLPAALEPIAAAVVVLLMLTALDAHSKAHLGFIPGRLAFRRLGDVARNGFDEIHKQPTPAPAHHGLVLLTVVGVAAIALIVDLVTVTLRRAALAGLPLLGLFTVCAATGHHGVGVVQFIFAAIGYLVLLYADNRDKVARWGAAMGTGSRARPASAWSTDTASAPAPASLGRQVGAVAISLGVIVPVFIPGLHTGINQHSTGTGGTSGGGSIHTYDPIVKIGSDLQQSVPAPVMTYQTSTNNPGYIRMTSLDQFNGLRFTSKQLTAPASQTANESLPVIPPRGQQVTTNYNINPTFVAQWLPTQATVLGVNIGEPWRYDPGTSTIFAATASTAGLSYASRSVPNQPTSAQLAAVSKPTSELDDLTLPMSLINPRVKDLEKRITADAPTAYDAALAIQRYLTDPRRFTYDATIPADTSSDALADFLFTSRRGFCQQFSTAMAVMARMDGIPARIAVGFTRGKLQPDGKTWLVTTHDAHAWPELWFQGYGWLAFEPTPRGDGQAVAPSYAKASSGSGQKAHGKNGNGKNGGPSDITPTQHPNPLPGSKDNTVPGASHSHRGAGSYTADAAWLIIIVLVAALIVPSRARALTRRRRWRALADPTMASAAAWAELRDTAIDLGAPWDDRRSPRQIAASLLRALDASPKTSDSLLRLADFEERARYAPVPKEGGADLRYDVTVVRAAAEAERTTAQRVRARVMPRSTILSARRGLARFGSRLERITQPVSPTRLIERTRARVARS